MALLYALNGADYRERFLAYLSVRDTPHDIRALLSDCYLRIFTCKHHAPHVVMETHLRYIPTDYHLRERYSLPLRRLEAKPDNQEPVFDPICLKMLIIPSELKDVVLTHILFDTQNVRFPTATWCPARWCARMARTSWSWACAGG